MNGYSLKAHERNSQENTPSKSDRPAQRSPGLPSRVAEKLGYYVYALRDPLRDDEIFYVGKGMDGRVYQHARRAKGVAGESANQLRLAQILKIQSAGLEVGVELIRHGLTDQKVAYAVEAAVIDALRLAGIPLTANIASGHGYGHSREPLSDVVARYAAKSVTIPADVKVLLIRLNRKQWLKTDAELLERTRKWWRLGPRRLKAEWAFTVYDGIVRAVFQIEGWEQPTKRDIKENPQRVGRWAFRGVQDSAMEAEYLFADVRSYLGSPGAQSPVKYVHC